MRRSEEKLLTRQLQLKRVKASSTGIYSSQHHIEITQEEPIQQRYSDRVLGDLRSDSKICSPEIAVNSSSEKQLENITQNKEKIKCDTINFDDDVFLSDRNKRENLPGIDVPFLMEALKSTHGIRWQSSVKINGRNDVQKTPTPKDSRTEFLQTPSIVYPLQHS